MEDDYGPLLHFLPFSPRGQSDLAPPTPSVLVHPLSDGGFQAGYRPALPKCGEEATAVFS